MKRLISLCLLLTMILSVAVVQAEDSTSANSLTIARQVIELANAQGKEVQVADVVLADAIAELDNIHFTVAVDGESTDTGTAGVKHYKCSASSQGSFTGLTINWWAYADVVDGIVVGVPFDEGFNFSFYSVPGTHVSVTGSVTAYTNNGGRRIRLDMNGSWSLYFLDIHIQTGTLNLTCSKDA